MENNETMDPQIRRIQGLLGRYLDLHASGHDTTAPGIQHLDEDSLSAFAEGNLSEREAVPIISHLVDCSYCRNVTTELVRLDMAFAEPAPLQRHVAEESPARISEVLGRVLSRIFGTADGAVFAHHEKEDEEEKKPESGSEE
ncbi:MAG TPA: zf-HC2 domain-containing protein [Pyrinomonadaceae bacterium]|jgi:hypothetical protein|nr:zf-HC2 domain-containing protein [Pyrinomonadaceae bacterium]